MRLSPRTTVIGCLAGILVAAPEDGHGYEDDHTVLATPAAALRAALEFVWSGPSSADHPAR